jgi:hypothetical protein
MLNGIIFKNYIQDKTLPIDKYKVRLSYIWLISNVLFIDFM